MPGFTVQVYKLPATFPITDPAVVAEVMRQVTDQVSRGFQSGPVRDAAGEDAGRWTFDSRSA